MKTLTFISLFFLLVTSVFAQQRGIGKSAGAASEDIGGTQHALLIGNNAYQYWQTATPICTRNTKKSGWIRSGKSLGSSPFFFVTFASRLKKLILRFY
jgi:hypothetical protein